MSGERRKPWQSPRGRAAPSWGAQWWGPPGEQGPFGRKWKRNVRMTKGAVRGSIHKWGLRVPGVGISNNERVRRQGKAVQMDGGVREEVKACLISGWDLRLRV